MTHLYRNSFFFTSLFLLTSCVMKEQKPERLLPPEPVLIKEDMIVKKSESPKEERGEALPTPQTEEEAQRSLPAWAHAKGDGVYKLGNPSKDKERRMEKFTVIPFSQAAIKPSRYLPLCR